MDIGFYQKEIKKYRKKLYVRNFTVDMAGMDGVERRNFNSTNWYLKFSIRECEDNIKRLQKVKQLLKEGKIND